MKTAMFAAPMQALELPSSRRWLEALNDWFRQASQRAMADDDTASWPTTADARALGAAARAATFR
jgi:hypothetical protein